MAPTTLSALVDGVLALALVIGATVLLALAKLDTTTGVLIYGVAITLVGGSAKALLALAVPVPSAAPAPATAPVTTTAPPPVA